MWTTVPFEASYHTIVMGRVSVCTCVAGRGCMWCEQNLILHFQVTSRSTDGRFNVFHSWGHGVLLLVMLEFSPTL